MAELAGVYRYVGAGGTVKRPTKEGPAMIFRKSRPEFCKKRPRPGSAAALLKRKPEILENAVHRGISGCTDGSLAAGRLASKTARFDLTAAPADHRRMTQARTSRLACVTLPTRIPGCTMCVTVSALEETNDDINGVVDNITLADLVESWPKLPISISIGVDPAIEIGSCFEPPTTPLGYDELSVAGALRKEPVELCHCVSVNRCKGE